MEPGQFEEKNWFRHKGCNKVSVEAVSGDNLYSSRRELRKIDERTNEYVEKPGWNQVILFTGKILLSKKTLY